MQFPIQNNEGQQFSPQVEYQTPNHRKRTHSAAEGQIYGMSASDQLQEYARANAAASNIGYSGANSVVVQAPIHGPSAPSEEYSDGVLAGPLSTYDISPHFDRSVLIGPGIIEASILPFHYYLKMSRSFRQFWSPYHLIFGKPSTQHWLLQPKRPRVAHIPPTSRMQQINTARSERLARLDLP